MINNIFNNLMNGASSSLSEVKNKILVASKKRAQENFESNIPSPEDFKKKLSDFSTNSPIALQKAEQTYNKTRDIIEKAISRLERSKQELESIKGKLLSINDKFDFLDGLVGPGSPIGDLVEILKGLPLVIDGILATQVTPVVSGSVINKAGDFKKLAKDNIQKIDDIINIIPIYKKFFDNQSETLLPPLDLGIKNLQNAIDQLYELLNSINNVWANFVLSLNINKPIEDTNEDGTIIVKGTTLNEYVSNPDNLPTIITDIILPITKNIYQEITENGPGTELREIRNIKSPIN